MLRSVNYGSTQSCAGGRVAVMPSVGRRKKLLVLGVAAAVLGVAAPRASADEVWFWACQAPDGAQLPFQAKPDKPGWFNTQTRNSGTVSYEDGCASNAPLTGALTQDDSSAAMTFGGPAKTMLTKVAVTRATHGFAAPVAGDNQTYTLSTDQTTLETLRRSTAQGDLSGPMTWDVPTSPSAGDSVQ